MSVLDVSVALQYSYFEEAKQKGLSIIRNEKLRNQLRRVYEFYYPLLEIQENEIQSMDHYHILYDELGRYFEIDSVSLAGPSKKLVFMNEKNYTQILKDKNLHYKIYDTVGTKKALLKMHILVRKEVLLLLEEINLEIKKRS